jgi:PKD repeat protein
MLTACKKSDYTNNTTTSTPVFSFNGTIADNPVSISAGLNNYFLNTSYSKDSNGVYTYTGEFMPVGCNFNCPNSLEIYFKDNTKYPQMTSAHIDSLLIPGYYNYAMPAGKESGDTVHFYVFLNQTPTNYSWNYGDGTQYNGTDNRPHFYSRPGIYTVIATISSSSGSTTDTNNVIVGQVGNAFSCFFGANFNLDTAIFSTSNNGIEPYTYIWDFGDGTTSNAAAPAHHLYASAGIYEVKCSATDALSYTATSRITIATPTASGTAGGFTQSIVGAPLNPLNLGDVGVEWYDASGKLWKSENNHQHTTALFQVSAVSNYQNNNNGEPVKSITAKIQCELYNGNDSIFLNGNAVFGVAHY